MYMFIVNICLVSTIVFVIVIIVEFSYYIQARMVAGDDCQLDDKGVFILTQLVYVLMQAHFLITTRKVHYFNSTFLY